MIKDRKVIYLVLVSMLVNLRVVHLQKPNVDARRHDVYIAGFFPFGKGVANSETG